MNTSMWKLNENWTSMKETSAETILKERYSKLEENDKAWDNWQEYFMN